MKHCTYNSQDLVLFRTTPTHHECVDSDGRIVEVPLSPSVTFHDLYKPSVPLCIPFSERPPGFITELRTKRDLYLQTVRKQKRKLHKGPESSGEPKAPRAKANRKDKMLSEMQQMIAARLATK